jgi:hypothetical protein
MRLQRNICLTFMCLLALNGAQARNKPLPSLQTNLAATRHHYSHLIAGEVPRLAELTLFANLLPKGGDVHHHYSGAMYAETYLDWVEMQNACIYRVTDVVLKIEKFRVALKPQELSADQRANCITIDAVRQDNGFYRELLQRWSDKDYDNHFHEQVAPDKQFFDTFGYFGAISDHDYHQGLLLLKARAKAENVSYLETMLKGAPTVDNPALDAAFGKLNATSSTQQIDDALADAYRILSSDADTRAKLDAYVSSLEIAASGLEDDDFKLRFQAYVSRNNPPAKVFSSLYTAFAAAQRSKWVVGVNIVGPENGITAMRDYSLHMSMFSLLKRCFPGTKVSLHAGELALGMVPPEGLRSHIGEAVRVAHADRIGHGIDIAHETDAPALLDTMKRHGVAVEVNLSSNAFILGVKNEAHPLMLYARYGVPFVISTDDAGVSRNNLSGEYLLYISRYKPSYDELKRTVYNSIRYAFLSDADKKDELKKLDQRFARFEALMAHQPHPH